MYHNLPVPAKSEPARSYQRYLPRSARAVFSNLASSCPMILRLTNESNFWYIDPMRTLFVADGRSPIAQNWIRYFVERGDEVYLASTFNCAVDFPLKALEITPVAFSGTKKSSTSSRIASSRAISLRAAIRRFFGPLTISRASKKLRGFIERVKPDLNSCNENSL